ncbi:spermidine/putrescine ABC transporter substrate-binding protein PotF, partial [Ruegeria sp. SCPC11]
MSKSSAAISMITFLSQAAFAEEVRVYNWSDYIDEGLLKKFEEETGLTLIYDVF